MQPMQPMQPTYPHPPQPPQPKRYVVPILAIISVAVTGVLLVCCLGLALLNALPTRSSAMRPQDTSSTSAPSVPPTIHAPTLGGTTDDFLAASALYRLIPGSRGLDYTATIAGQTVDIQLGPADPSHSPDGQAHLALLDIQPPSDQLATASWSAAVADQIAQTFLPADAHLQRIMTVAATGAVAASGGVVEHLYTSASLADTFTANQFTSDTSHQLVAPGTLNYSCQRLVASLPGLDDCLIAIGSL